MLKLGKADAVLEFFQNGIFQVEPSKYLASDVLNICMVVVGYRTDNNGCSRNLLFGTDYDGGSDHWLGLGCCLNNS